MATSKPTGTSKAPPKTRNTNSKRQNEILEKDRRRRQIYSVILFAVGILLFLFSFIGKIDSAEPNLADYIHKFLYGMFGVSVFFIGPIVIYIAVMISSNKRKSTVTVKMIQLLTIILLLSATMQILFVGEVSSDLKFGEVISSTFELGTQLKGGGVIGLIIGLPLLLFGRVAASIIIILIVFVVIMITANISLVDFLKILSKPFKKLGGHVKEKGGELREESRILREENQRLKREEQLLRENAVSDLENQEIQYEISRKAKFSSIEAATNSVRSITPTVSEEKEQSIASLEYAIEENRGHVITENLAEKDIFVDMTESEQEEITPKLEPFNSDDLPEDDDGPFYPNLGFEKTRRKNAVFEAIDEFNREETEKVFEMLQNESSLINNGTGEDLTASGIISSTGNDEIIIEASDDIDDLVQPYTLPPIVLLNDIVAERNQAEIDAELNANAEKLVETLKSFGVMTKFVGTSRGPTVTRYELQPAAGVKISKITGLVDDIALNLATAGVRIEAPIPNKAAVGIEVPNRKIDTVPFRSLVDSEVFNETQSKLGAALGKDISGEIVIADMAKMPHILIAGTTGSGKSVCVNSIIMSILFRSTPDEVRLLMIDPKAVEFMIYNGIPHLLIPVVTDPKKAAGALSWAVTEMLNRYKMFSDNNVRDLAGYNALAKKNPDIKPLPQIVIFIDELADLMMASPKDVEDSICRLAQMARAAGMHLVIATQRPSVNVVTGVIKANIPSRIALKVASQVDSRTIIDSAGAEKLLGKGDMLYFPVGAPKPMRIQGCWVSDKEVDRVVNFIKNSFTLDYDEYVISEIERKTTEMESNEKNADTGGGEIDFSDDKLDEAIEAVIDAGQASTSYLQRKLKLGYGRAARLIDTMEEMGVVGPFEGSKPRQVIMTKQEWYERKLNQS